MPRTERHISSNLLHVTLLKLHVRAVMHRRDHIKPSLTTSLGFCPVDYKKSLCFYHLKLVPVHSQSMLIPLLAASPGQICTWRTCKGEERMKRRTCPCKPTHINHTSAVRGWILRFAPALTCVVFARFTVAKTSGTSSWNTHAVPSRVHVNPRSLRCSSLRCCIRYSQQPECFSELWRDPQGAKRVRSYRQAGTVRHTGPCW